MVIKLTISDIEFQEWRRYMSREGYIPLMVSDATAVTMALEVHEMNPEYVEVNRDIPSGLDYVRVDCCDTCMHDGSKSNLGCEIHKRIRHMYIPTDMYKCASYLQE